MKKVLVPALLTAAAVLVSFLCQRHTLVCQEYDGLFLWAPDYFSWVLSRPLPVSQTLADFMTQFYRIAACGPWLVGLQVLLAWLLLKGILPRKWTIVPTLGACAEWLVIAFSPTAKPGVAILLFLTILWLVSLFFRRGNETSGKWPWIPAALVVVCALVVAFHPAVRHTERWAKVKSGVIYQKPDRVLSAATPARVQKERELTPFALLALGDKFELSERMFEYPVYEENDFDMCLEEDYYNSLFFRAFLYDRLRCEDEACHNLFQLATQQKHGMSFMVLRQLVTEYYRQGDYGLVEKYCRILDRSSAHREFTASFRRLMKEGVPREKDTPETRGEAPLITRNPLYNLMQLSAQGKTSDYSVDRLLCTLLLQRDLQRFGPAFEAAVSSPRFANHIPVVYQEGMLLYYDNANVPIGERVNWFAPHTMGRHRRFMEQMDGGVDVKVQQAGYGDTYWFYYYYAE